MATMTESRERGNPSRSGGGAAIGARDLETALREAIRGEVRFDRGSRGMYATDAS
nr:hypothetical protein [Gemmatimonadota bacterium]NIT87001.1 hypothetical protein [Gemmatimonadota bacterium]NIU79227.1 hypothetical protein [Gammaproteobacteria bacterium]NIY12279.1 hypothetical protein [Gemmatimonadota bacterium]